MAISKVTLVAALIITLTVYDLEVHGNNTDKSADYSEGDILIDNEPAPNPSRSRVKRTALISPESHWENATVPYAFAPSYRSSFISRRLFKKATDYMSSKTCLRFIPRTNEKDYIYILSGNGCFSELGRKGGRQLVSLPLYECTDRSTIVHELMHSLGFIHEHTRPNRDKYVKINWENIQPGDEEQFQIFGSKEVSGYGVGYDYKSVMHYDRFTSSKFAGYLPTIERIGPGSTVFGQTNGMSEGDIEKINIMYC